MLSAREAFKVGFLGRCVEDGCSAEEIAGRVKRAADLLEKEAQLDTALGLAGKGLGGLWGLGKGLVTGVGLPLGQAGLIGAALAPPIAGGLAGYGLAKATDIDDADVAEVKNQEVLDEYRRQTDKLRRQKALREFTRANQVRPRSLL